MERCQIFFNGLGRGGLWPFLCSAIKSLTTFGQFYHISLRPLSNRSIFRANEQSTSMTNFPFLEMWIAESPLSLPLSKTSSPSFVQEICKVKLVKLWGLVDNDTSDMMSIYIGYWAYWQLTWTFLGQPLILWEVWMGTDLSLRATLLELAVKFHPVSKVPCTQLTIVDCNSGVNPIKSGSMHLNYFCKACDKLHIAGKGFLNRVLCI